MNPLKKNNGAIERVDDLEDVHEVGQAKFQGIAERIRNPKATEDSGPRIIKKQIIFNVSEEDHQLIKQLALQKGVSMRILIIDALADLIKKEMENS